MQDIAPTRFSQSLNARIAEPSSRPSARVASCGFIRPNGIGEFVELTGEPC